MPHPAIGVRVRDAVAGVVLASLLAMADHKSRMMPAVSFGERPPGPPWGWSTRPGYDGVWFGASGGEWSWVAIVLSVVIGLAVALRGLAPRVAGAVVAVATAGYLLNGGPWPLALVAPALCVFTLARVRPSSEWWIPAVGSAAMLWAGSWNEPWLGLDQVGTWFGIAFGVMVIMLPALIRVMRRDRHAAHRERRDEELRRVADTERLRLARDVHDVVGHSLSMISLQAGVALHVIDRNPDQVRASLQAIRDASRTSLTDLRHTLGALRTESGGVGQGADGEPEAVRTPTPDLAAITQLVAGVRAAGREVALVSTGDAGAVPAGHQHAAYRIVQESLTNAVRHAPNAPITVTVGVAEQLVIEVADTGLPGGTGTMVAEVAPGNGLLGITERVTALGGTVRYGHRGADGSGGFAVRAEIPLPERVAEGSAQDAVEESDDE